MDVIRIKNRLSNNTGELLAALLFAQPLLDVLSYFMQQFGSTTVTTSLRMVMLTAVGLLGLVMAQNRKPYYIFLGIAGGYWLLHALNCLRIGYQDPLADLAEYLKLIQFPLWTLCFLTFLREKPELDVQTAGLLAVNFVIIILVIGLSYAAGRPEYTYANIQIGVLGWFAIANTQSAIVSMLTIGLLLWAYRTGRVLVFTGAELAGFGLLYLTATRLAYYSAILIAAGFLVLILIAGGRQRLCCIPLAVGIVLLVLSMNSSPMTQRREIASQSYDIYQAQTDQIMGADKDFTYTGGPLEPELERKIRRVYEEVYTQRDVKGNPLLGDLLERFGTDRVMEAYHYSVRAETLYRTRTKKLTTASLVRQDHDAITRLLGCEYAAVTLNGTNYDPENDFPALLCYYGWAGAGLYCCFAAGVILLVLGGAVRNLRRLPQFLTVELGAYTMILILGLGAGQYSGQALRKPNMTVYMSLAAAQIINLSRGENRSKLFARYERRSAVTLKKL